MSENLSAEGLAALAARTPPEPINWDCDPTTDSTITEIVDRYLTLIEKAWDMEQRLHHRMNLTACHLNGCPLDLDKMLEAPDFVLAHDIQGIDRFIDRTTGRIDPALFDPRCALPATEEA